MSVINLPYLSADVLQHSEFQPTEISHLSLHQEKVAKVSFEPQENTQPTDTSSLVKQNIVVKSVYSRDANQILRNAKVFYKRKLESESKCRRFRVMRQIKRPSESPELAKRNQSQYVDHLAEVNLKIFKNMNQLLIVDNKPKNGLNDSILSSKEENGIIKPAIKIESKKYRKEKFSLINARKASVFIPPANSYADEDISLDSPLDNQIVYGRKHKDSSSNLLAYSVMKIPAGPNRQLRQKFGKNSIQMPEKLNCSMEPTSTSPGNYGNNMSSIVAIGIETNPDQVVLPRILKNSLNYQDKNTFKNYEVKQKLACLLSEKSPLNKNTMTLIGKLVRTGVMNENNDKNNKNNLLLQMFNPQLAAKSRRSHSTFA